MSQISTNCESFESKLSELEARFKSIPGSEAKLNERQQETAFDGCLTLLGDCQTLHSDVISENLTEAEKTENLAVKVAGEMCRFTDVPKEFVSLLATFSKPVGVTDQVFGDLHERFLEAYETDERTTEDEVLTTIAKLKRLVRDYQAPMEQVYQNNRKLYGDLNEFMKLAENCAWEFENVTLRGVMKASPELEEASSA